MTLRLKDSDGKAFRWRLWRDRRPPARRMLETHDGVLRSLEESYLLSVPRVRMIASNYGLAFLHDFS